MPVSTLESTKNKRMQNVVSALTARTQLGQILKRASEKDERFVVDRRGKPSVIIMSVRDYIRNIAPTPPALRATQKEARRKGTATLSMAQIDREIAAVRREQSAEKKTKLSKR